MTTWLWSKRPCFEPDDPDAPIRAVPTLVGLVVDARTAAASAGGSMDCCTWGAGAYVALPAWFASTTQVPEALNMTTPPLIEHTLVELASMVKLTGSPDVAVAVGV